MVSWDLLSFSIMSMQDFDPLDLARFDPVAWLAEFMYGDH